MRFRFIANVLNMVPFIGIDLRLAKWPAGKLAYFAAAVKR